MPSTSPSLGWLRRGIPALAVLCASGAIAACGSDSATDTTSTAASGSGGASNSASNSQNAAQTKLRDCLRGQGIDLPAASAGSSAPPQNIDRDKLQAAFDGPCKDEQQAATGDVSADDQQQFQDQLTKFTSCMRKEGVDVPDVSSSGGVPAGGNPLDQDDPKVKAATEKCRDQLPQGLPGGGNGQ